MEEPEAQSVLPSAFKYSIPVLFGYTAIGTAFGLVMADAGYPWWLSLAMSLIMFAGAGQFIAAGLLAAGAGIFEAMLIQLVVNARHAAYSMSMLSRFKNAGLCRFYLIFGLTDETFALLSSMPHSFETEEKQAKFMFYVTALNQCYWVAGTLIGSVTGSLIPFNTEGIGFALTSLFVVLMIDKILLVRKSSVFIMTAIITVAAVYFLPLRISLLAAMIISLLLSPAVNKISLKAGE